MLEVLDTAPACDVSDAEYRRLLGYPRDHVPSVRARELAAWARRWYAEHGRPWVYMREAELRLESDTLQLDGEAFQSRKLHEHFVHARAQRAVLVAVSAGRACEEHARQLWQDAKPDEYFFLEIFGSAVVEHLVASLSGRICDAAERDGLMAVPHYSPGYAGWDVAEQPRLFELITRRQNPSLAFPESLEVLPSGMLRPKKSLLGVFGLTARTEEALRAPQLIPCENCSFAPCRYRRAACRHQPATIDGAAATHANGPTPAKPPAKYSLNPRALRKWADERVELSLRHDRSVEARFRFDGTTCSNMGRPLAFDYRLTLSPPERGYTILAADCRPAADDTGHMHMCAYLGDPAGLMRAIADEKPLLGEPLDAVLTWQRVARPSGCFCDAASRAHKWGLALEVIHFALSQRSGPAVQPSPQNSLFSVSS